MVRYTRRMRSKTRTYSKHNVNNWIEQCIR